MAENPLFLFVVCLLVISAYCLPTIIAFSRGHPNRYLIAVVTSPADLRVSAGFSLYCGPCTPSIALQMRTAQTVASRA